MHQSRRKHWGRWVLGGLVVIVVLLVASLVYLDTSLKRRDVLADYPGRVGQTKGTNWLLVGTDSRDGLSAAQERKLSTGGEVGPPRTDTILLLHVPKSGRASMISIPRDSYVPIPDNGRNKINAAFAEGGATLLVRTLEAATGLHIDHYAEIGLGGFAGLVDAVGGIDMCLPAAMKDPLAGIDLPAGCQKLSGVQSLGFVRSRATPTADLARMDNQRRFMSVLLKKVAGPSTYLNPFRLGSVATNGVDALTVDSGVHLWTLIGLGMSASDDPLTTTVPIGGFQDVSGVGNVVRWDRDKASRFFGALAADNQIPDDLRTPE